jgi:hypothetical protein
MKAANRFFVIVAFAVGIILSWGNPAPVSSAAASAQHKVDHIQTNGALAKSDPSPTIFTEKEINAYIASGKVQLPEGVQSVRLVGTDSVVTGTARVDFDVVKAERKSSNPLLSVFSGVHDVEVEAHVQGRRGVGIIHVESVALDGAEIPHFLLELFLEKYVRPKHPNVGMDTRVHLPNKIDTATVGKHILTVVQR